MNNYICPKCNHNNLKTSSFCTKCGYKLKNENTPQTKKDHGNTLGIITLSLYYGGATIFGFIANELPEPIQNYASTLVGLCPIAAIIILVVGRVNYPENKLLKIAMWLIIISIILSIVLMIIFMAWCYITCSSVDLRGCS